MRTYDQSEIDKLNRVITWVAAGTARSFPDSDPEDLSQGLWEIVVLRGIGPEKTGLKTFLRRRAKELAWRNRKECLALSAQYVYRPDDVRQLLHSLRHEDWHGRAPDDAVEGDGDHQAGWDVRVDVLIGLQSLTGLEYRAILSRYQPPIVIPAHGSKEAKILNRAITRLTDHMNSYMSHRPMRRTSAQVRAGIEDQG